MTMTLMMLLSMTTMSVMININDYDGVPCPNRHAASTAIIGECMNIDEGHVIKHETNIES